MLFATLQHGLKSVIVSLFWWWFVAMFARFRTWPFYIKQTSLISQTTIYLKSSSQGFPVEHEYKNQRSLGARVGRFLDMTITNSSLGCLSRGAIFKNYKKM